MSRTYNIQIYNIINLHHFYLSSFLCVCVCVFVRETAFIYFAVNSKEGDSCVMNVTVQMIKRKYVSRYMHTFTNNIKKKNKYMYLCIYARRSERMF